MYIDTNIPWSRIHDYLVECGRKQDPREYCISLIDGLNSIIPFDQARVYFVNDNGKVFHEHLIGVDKKWTEAYHEYYSQLDNGAYSLFGKTTMPCGRYSILNRAEERVRDWTAHSSNEFVRDYVRPQGLCYSLGIILHDVQGSPKTMYILDRICPVPFSRKELGAIDLAWPHLDNLHRNFFVQIPGHVSASVSDTNCTPLTTRESEIADLLIKGITPANISKKLYISSATVYKHLAHIHTKLNVTNRQELILKLMQK